MSLCSNAEATTGIGIELSGLPLSCDSCHYIPTSSSAAIVPAFFPCDQCLRIPKLLPLPRRRFIVRKQHWAPAGCHAQSSDDPWDLRVNLDYSSTICRHLMGDIQRAFIREVVIRAEGCCHQTLPLNIAPIAAVARSRPTVGLAPLTRGLLNAKLRAPFGLSAPVDWPGHQLPDGT